MRNGNSFYRNVTVIVVLITASCSPRTTSTEAKASLVVPGLVSPKSGQQVPQSATLGQTTKGAYVKSALWNKLTGPTQRTHIPVCWETEKLDSLKKLAQSAVEETWESYANIDFSGWVDCTTSSPGIHIKITHDGRARVNWFGSDLNGRKDGMELNLGYSGWENTACKDTPNRCLRAVTIHEFGHALGLVHEQLNPKDAPPPSECNAERDPPYPTHSATIYDNASIMNYCNKNWIAGDLSGGDIETITLLYGAIK